MRTYNQIAFTFLLSATPFLELYSQNSVDRTPDHWPYQHTPLFKSNLKQDNFYYVGFGASIGGTPYHAQGGSTQVTFDYSYSGLSGNYNYHASYQWPSRNTFALDGTGSFELGLSHGPFVSGSVGGLHTAGTTSFYELELGYNINLNNFDWTLRPSIGSTNMLTSDAFPQTIDNTKGDAIIFGNTFPYEYTNHNQSGIEYSKLINIGMRDYSHGVKIQFGMARTLKITPEGRTSLQLNLGYRFYPVNEFTLYAKSKATDRDIPVNSGGLQFSNGDIPLQRMFGFQGLYCDLTLQLRLHSLNISKLRRTGKVSCARKRNKY